MNNLDKRHIEIFREYFLSQNEDIRRSIRNILPGILVKYLSIIETGFSKNVSVEIIASQIEANHLIPELQQLQSDYYSSLDRIFEEELDFAIRTTERESLKKKFELIDSEEEFQLDESDIKSAITQVERESLRNKLAEIHQLEEISEKVAALIPATNIIPAANTHPIYRILKYATAAVVIGIVFFGSYVIFNNKKNQNVAIKENKQLDSTNLNSLNPTEKLVMSQTCLSTEELFRENFSRKRNEIDAVEGIWELDNYIEVWNNEKLVGVDSIINISSWSIFQISPNIFRVCDIDKGFSGEKVDIDFIAYIEKRGNTYTYFCNFLKDKEKVQSQVRFLNRDVFVTGYFLPQNLKAQNSQVDKKSQIRWAFTWRKIFPR